MNIKEWQRTIILLALIAIAIGCIVWSHYAYDVNFIRSL